ncbi:transcriptional regulator, DeoR family [Agreia bicolorata]|uniref:Transcriptional regulator n=1 Tax=Agreia bicolorata TaxID=110935 RepID=A0A1T4YMJ7_9MICO|nr:DeoR/GlpR family DNA-binding transcription regulator [Agreia bicolorata]KJC64378.1 transcriptional regulator [Agreia bicolorata]SKB02495.1 transcriptional regulator, DeoR family [Agreia bicolorata]
MSSTSPLIPEQRHQEVLRLLRSAGVLSIRHLAELLGVSHMTVRRDIAALEESGQVASVQGGVRLSEWTSRELPRERGSRAMLELPRKRAIAELAAGLVRDRMVVFLDAGTTCEAVVPFIATRQGLTVVTNDFFVVTTLFDYPGIETIHTGGAVDISSGSSSGPLAAATVGAVSIDLAFLSTGAWDLAHGLTTPTTEKVSLKRAAMDAASTCVLLADSTKFGTFDRFKVAPLDAIDVIITDAELSDDGRSAVTELGVDLRLASI